MASSINRASPPASWHLQIRCDDCTSWSVHGLGPEPMRNLPSLRASLDYARLECGGAPATIELMIESFYAVIHQEEGWPRQLVGPDAAVASANESGTDAALWRRFARLRQWLGIAA
jgi:hypothetical protein